MQPTQAMMCHVAGVVTRSQQQIQNTPRGSPITSRATTPTRRAAPPTAPRQIPPTPKAGDTRTPP
eukprot:3374881-Pyramimonas_sp.AAC.1